jgi:predicted ATPase
MLHLKKNHWKSYSQVITSLRSLLPDLEDLEVEFTHTRSLALFVRQRGQLWPAEDLSDGTVQAIATLTAIFDPRTPLLILEEPENNVHPWALRSFAEAFREASKTKQIILTTHSPILLDQLRPEEIWIVQKPGAFTKIDPLLTLDPSLKDSWERGSFTLSEYLDSGALPEAVPAAAP